MSCQVHSGDAIVATMVGSSGVVMSTKPVPRERPMMAYSRPAGETYPQQSFAEVLPPPNSPMVSQARRSTPSEGNPMGAFAPSRAAR